MKTQLVNPNFKTNYLEELLKFRGVIDYSSYINPTDIFLQEPECLDNMAAGAELLQDALMKDMPIALVVDCDVDGFTSSAVMYQYIKLISPSTKIDYYLHEHKGHGLEDILPKIIDSNISYSLVITPDAGSNDYEYHEQLKEMGVPVLVLDHHELDIDVSSNCVLINNQTSTNYINKDLTGVGVVWQFCRYLDKIMKNSFADNFIDLVALGVDADMGSVLSMENRYIMVKGFSNIKNEFFMEMARKQKYSLTGNVSANDSDIIESLKPISVAFYIVPLMNAIIRIGTMGEKERLFLSLIEPNRMVECHKRGAKGTQERVCIESIRECVNARKHQNDAIDNMMGKLEVKIFKHDLLENKVLFIRLDEDDVFPSEINGILAMKLSKKYKKPTIVARLNNEGYIRGSIRGLDACELKDFKQFLTGSGLFEYVQGHANAAGCSINEKNLSKLHEYANEELAAIDFGEDVYDINFERISADEDLEQLIYELDKYPDVWGTHNPTPELLIKDICFNINDMQIMGKNKDTVKILSHGIEYMKFFGKDFIQEINDLGTDNIKLDIIGKAKINSFRGINTPQITIDAYNLKIDNGF